MITIQYPDRDPQMFYELSRQRHAEQAESLNVLDGKLGLVLSSSSALLGLLIAVYALRPGSFHAPAHVLLAASVVAWVVLSVFALHALWHREWKNGPLLQDVFDLHFSEDAAKLQWRVATVYWRDYDQNKLHEKRKVRALNWALSLFVTQTALLVSALVLAAVYGSETPHRSQSVGPGVRDAQVLGSPPSRTYPDVPGLAGRLHSSRQGPYS